MTTHVVEYRFNNNIMLYHYYDNPLLALYGFQLYIDVRAILYIFNLVAFERSVVRASSSRRKP